MKATTEMKFVVPKGWVVKEEVVDDGSRVFTIKPDTTAAYDTTCHQWEGIFKLVPASQLSLNDNFMNHIPKTKREKNFMEKVKKVIRAGMHDFWCPVCDPSFDNKGRICYEPGNSPAVGKSYNWWARTAKEFKPEQGSRLGTETERIAFLAVLIKELVNSGKSVEWAWNAVCNDSKELGHYRSSENAKHAFEDTGNREVCGWCDLGNVGKIVAEDKKIGSFWIAGGGYNDYSNGNPLVELYNNRFRNDDRHYSCGWIVLTEGSTDH